MDIEIPVKADSYHKSLLMIMNIPFNLNLRPLEIDMLACMLKHDMKIIDVYSREKIRKDLDKDKYVTNNYIVRLREKNILVTKPADKNLYLNPKIIEMVKDPNMNFKLHIVN